MIVRDMPKTLEKLIFQRNLRYHAFHETIFLKMGKLVGDQTPDGRPGGRLK
jgi:hypothetical protein